MKLVKINPNNMSYYSRHFISGFECGAKRQLEADKRSIPKGHWIKISPANIYECSICNQDVLTHDIDAYQFCHHCGADMRGGDND